MRESTLLYDRIQNWTNFWSVSVRNFTVFATDEENLKGD
jgi:hypothetical protein